MISLKNFGVLGDLCGNDFSNGQTCGDKWYADLESNLEQYSDFWSLPDDLSSDSLQLPLSTGGSSISGDKLTLPGCCLESDLLDRVPELTCKYLACQNSVVRSILKVDSVTQDDKGLQQLIEADCLKAAVNLTSRLLESYGQGFGRIGRPSKHTVHSVKLWSVRLALLVRLGEFSVAEKEAVAWNNPDTPDLWFQCYRELYGNRQGSMVPFRFRLLLAEVPRHTGRIQLALDKLYTILSVCDKILNSLSGVPSSKSGQEDTLDRSRRLWQERKAETLVVLARCHLVASDHCQSIWTLQSALACRPQDAVWLVSAMAIVYLETGDLAGARRLFDSVRRHCEAEESSDSATTTGLHHHQRQQHHHHHQQQQQHHHHHHQQQHHHHHQQQQRRVQLLVNTALLALAESDYNGALAAFSGALRLAPTSSRLANSVAVCQLYSGRLDAAVDTLQALVLPPSGETTSHHHQQQHHQQQQQCDSASQQVSGNDHDRTISARAKLLCQQPSLVLNLCTLYDLQTPKCNRRKVQLLQFVAKYCGDSFDIACLKLL